MDALWHEVIANHSALNCSRNGTLPDNPELARQNAYTTAVLSGVSVLACIGFVGQNICAKTHNQWPHSQILWLAYSVLALNAFILLGAFWNFSVYDMPAGFCIAQGIGVQFAGVLITGWFLVVTLTMRQMIMQQNTVHQLAGRSRVLSLVVVFSAAIIFTVTPAVVQFVTGDIIFGPSPYNTWCWITTCQWPYWQLIFYEGGMLVVVVSGSVVAMVAMCRLWSIRKYSSQSFQPRIRIYMYRRLTFITIYALEIVFLLISFIVFKTEGNHDSVAYLLNKAILCSAGLLLFISFGLPDSCCMCRFDRGPSKSKAAATSAALQRQAVLEASEFESGGEKPLLIERDQL